MLELPSRTLSKARRDANSRWVPFWRSWLTLPPAAVAGGLQPADDGFEFILEQAGDAAEAHWLRQLAFLDGIVELGMPDPQPSPRFLGTDDLHAVSPIRPQTVRHRPAASVRRRSY